MSTVRCSSWPIATARLKAMVVLPTPPLGAKTDRIRGRPVGRRGRELLLHVRRSGSSGRSPRTASRGRRGCPRSTSTSTGFCGTVRTITGTPRPASWICSTSLQALDPALQERVDEDDVRPQLADLGEHLAAVGDDVEQLHRRLRVEQPADVLRDLGDVLDDQQACLIAARMPDIGLDDTTRPVGRPPGVPRRTGRGSGRAVAADAAQGRSAITIARSEPGPNGSRS